MKVIKVWLLLVSLCCCFDLKNLFAEEKYAEHTFKRQQLTNIYYSEGANAGDLNGDGKQDIVYGPYWFKGPEYQEKLEIYKPVPQNVEGYADNFFNWVYDFNHDGKPDVFVVGFPGTPAYVYENPGKDGHASHWKKHQVFDWVSNESPQFVNIVGDETPELVCTRDGYYGYASIDKNNPLGIWVFHPVSEKIATPKFGHGLGIGDINGDGLQDIIHYKGWFEQPKEHKENSRWLEHKVSFSNAYGGAEMYAYDVDGDGDSDVITSLAAHDFGLAWYEQVKEGDEINFKMHLIMGKEPAENKYGLVFSELHSVNLVDIDGDGLKDIITGKTYYSHHKGSPLWDAGAVTFWFKLVRNKDGVDWIPFKADGEAGIGRQLTVMDINGDGLQDFVLGGMKGAHALIHEAKPVTKEAWVKALPAPGSFPAPVSTAKPAPKPVVNTAKSIENAIEGEYLTFTNSGGNVRSQAMGNFKDGKWSGNSQLWWTGGNPGDVLKLTLPEFEGKVDLEIVLTKARDYGIVELSLDDQKLGQEIDLYDTKVVTTGVIKFEGITTQGKKHQLNVRIKGANPKADQEYMFALDYLTIKLADGSYVKPLVQAPGVKEIQSFIPVKAYGKSVNVDFETGTLDDWVATGDAFEKQPIKGDTVSPRRGDMKSGHIGNYWIGGYEPTKNDKAQGTLTSVPFMVNHPYASFYFNGGKHAETRVELIRQDTGNVFYKSSGIDNEELQQHIVDLRAHQGKEIKIRLVDEHSGGWGHVNFDHFRFHDQAPAKATTPQIALTPDEYPFSGMTGPEAVKVMKLPNGFQIQLAAAEPDIKQPIAMALDDRGRVWVAEAYEYPIRSKEAQGRDRILIFEDTNEDGVLDKRKVFIEGLNLISGFELGFGGVWVGAAPYFMFIPDKNGDDIPDAEPEILLDGWGYQDTHETLNAFIWGPDGWLYGCHGVFTHSKVGKPGTPDDQRTPINAGVWRYHPTKHVFEVFAHGTSNPWGVDFNDHGQAFITACVIPHLYHMIQGGRYQRQAGQHFNKYTYKDIVTIADHLHYLGATPHSGNNKSDAAGGGHAHCGAMIYLGDGWPAIYRNQLFMNNIHGQRLNTDVLKPVGSGYVGTHGPDFLLTGDKASQIINMMYGPDGSVWVIDWYDMQACHSGKIDAHDRSNGRIYRISYGIPAAPLPEIELKKATDEELAELMLMENDWYVRHARRILQERAAVQPMTLKAIEFLEKIATTHKNDTRRLRALWALHVIKQLSPETIAACEKDVSPYVRGWLVQLQMEIKGDQPDSATLAKFVNSAKTDNSQVVRMYLASAAQRMPLKDRWELLTALVSHPEDAKDHNLPLLYWYAAEPLADVDTSRALAWGIQAGESIPILRDYMLKRIGSSDQSASLAALVEGLGKAGTNELKMTFLQAIRASLKGSRKVTPPENWSKVSQGLINSSDSAIKLQAVALGVTFGDTAAMKVMRESVMNEEKSQEDRLLALQSLIDAKDAGLMPTLLKLLEAKSNLRDEAIKGLAQYDDPAIAAKLMGLYNEFSPDQKRLALGTLTARAQSGLELLKAIELKKIPGSDLTADLVRQLQFHQNKELQELLAKTWGTVRESEADKLQMIANYKKLVESTAHPAADLPLGRDIFARTCMKCHQLYGAGQKIGPDLTGSNRANLDYLLSNIVDPSAVMAKEYLQSIIQTDDGRVVSGIIKSEDNRALTVQTSDALVTIPREEILDRKDSEKSMMPDDQLKLFKEQEVRALIAYLQAKQQTPVLATPENAINFFNGKDLTGWSGKKELWSVENGELVGRTDGLKKNEWIVSDYEVRDFKLTVEVKLVDNAGNSGIQFRSHAVGNGEVSGYQADVGKGWWGKLYEEHGRGLIWDKSGESHVKNGEWNTYVVEARGSKLQTWINGQLCVDLDDSQGKRSGIIAFQLHSGGKTEVRYRNMKLEVFGSDTEIKSLQVK